MGIEIPIDWPEISSALWYKVTVDTYRPLTPGAKCTNWIASQTACIEGFVLKAWIRNDKQCTFELLIGELIGGTQRITKIENGYGDFAACFSDL